MSNNNKNRKLRAIIVNNKLYYWLASNPNCDGDFGIRFKIYRNKNVVYDTVLHGMDITPKFVEKIILDNNL